MKSPLTDLGQENRSIAATPIRGHQHQPGKNLYKTNSTSQGSVNLVEMMERFFPGKFVKKKKIYGFVNKKLSSLYDSQFAKPHTLSIRTGNAFPSLFAALANHFYNYSPSYIAGIGVPDKEVAKRNEEEPIQKSDSIILTTVNVSDLSGKLTSWAQNRIKAKELITHQSILEIAEDLTDLLNPKNHLTPSASISKVAIDLYLPIGSGVISEIKLGGDIDTGKVENTLVKNFLLPYLCLGNPEVTPYYSILSKTCKPGKALALERVLHDELTLIEDEFFQKLFPGISYSEFETVWCERIDQLTETVFCSCNKQLAGHWNYCPNCGLQKS